MMDKEKYILAAGAVVLFILIVLIGTLQHYGGQTEPEVKPKVGFILQGAFEERGWNHNHYLGLQAAAETMELQLDGHENTPAGSEECRRIIKEMSEAGERLIFLASADYAQDLAAVRGSTPREIFVIPALEHPADEHVVPYFIRLYQGEYLAGVLAGARTKTGRIGYVASMPIPETIRGINAFALGIRRVNPQAQLIVHWIGSWDNSKLEVEATENLIDRAGVDVLNSHQDRHSVQETAAARGVDSIGYQETMKNATEHSLATVVCDWSVPYRRILQDYQQGQLNSGYWLGFPEKAIDLTDYSPSLTEEQRQAVEQAKQDIRSGHNMFSGEIRDLAGNIRCEADESITDETLISIDWFVEGVKFYE